MQILFSKCFTYFHLSSPASLRIIFDLSPSFSTLPHSTNLVSGLCSIFAFPSLVVPVEIPVVSYLLQEGSKSLPQLSVPPLLSPISLHDWLGPLTQKRSCVAFIPHTRICYLQNAIRRSALCANRLIISSYGPSPALVQLPAFTHPGTYSFSLTTIENLFIIQISVLVPPSP